MIISYFYINWASFDPFETNPILLINTYAKFSFPITRKGLKAVTRRNLQLHPYSAHPVVGCVGSNVIREKNDVVM